MLSLRIPDGPRLVPLPAGRPASEALWVDLLHPSEDETQVATPLAPKIPGREEMRDIEISHRLYRMGNTGYMTVMLPGAAEADSDVHHSGPVTFILTLHQLITLRHHEPASFTLFPQREDLTGLQPGRPDLLFLALCEEIVGQLADLLELSGDRLTAASQEIYARTGLIEAPYLQKLLRRIGMENDVLGQVRAGLLSLSRALRYFLTCVPDVDSLEGRLQDDLLRDIDALELHADSLHARLGFLTELTVGLIGLGDNKVAKAQSMVAALFLPPTLLASIYGMNFDVMPGTAHPHGFWIAIGGMLAASLGCWLFFRWRGWF